MAVQKEPILKKCRYLGISPAVLGVSKKESIRFKNANNRKKISEYGLQLKEKQKLKFIYGVHEKQFYHYFEIASKMEGKAYVFLDGVGEQLIQLLCRITIHIGGAMGVDVHRHGNICMTKAGLHSLGIHTGLQQCRSTAMAQIVETNGLQAMLVQKASPHSGEGFGAILAAVLLGKDQTGILKRTALSKFVADVLCMSLLQLGHHLGSHCQITDTGGTLGSLGQGTFFCDDLILTDMDNAVGKVYMLPTQGQHLTTTQTKVSSQQYRDEQVSLSCKV